NSTTRALKHHNMADISASDDLRRQLDAHVQSLRAAGVEWLPIGPPLLMAAPIERAPMPAASGGKDQSMAQLAQPAVKQALRADPLSTDDNTLEQRRQAL